MRSTNLFVWMRHFKSIYQHKSNKIIQVRCTKCMLMGFPCVHTAHTTVSCLWWLKSYGFLFSLSKRCSQTICMCVRTVHMHNSCVQCLFVIKNLNTCNQCNLLFDTYGSPCYVRLCPFLRSFTSSSIWLIVESFAFNQNNINNRSAQIPMRDGMQKSALAPRKKCKFIRIIVRRWGETKSIFMLLIFSSFNVYRVVLFANEILHAHA